MNNQAGCLPLVIGAFLIALIIGFLVAWLAMGARGEFLFVVLAACIVLALATKPLAAVWQHQQQFRDALSHETQKIERREIQIKKLEGSRQQFGTIRSSDEINSRPRDQRRKEKRRTGYAARNVAKVDGEHQMKRFVYE